MEKLQFIVILGLCIWATQTRDTTKEPNEGEQISFIYNGYTHNLVIRISQSRTLRQCYVVTLTDEEHAGVHDDSTMRQIEKKYLVMLAGAKNTTSDMLSKYDQKACGHAPNNVTMEFYTL